MFRTPFWVLLGLLGVAASASAQGYQTDFKTDDGWTFSGGDGAVEWGVDGTPTGTTPHSPPSTLNYNDGTTYDSMEANGGSATSPVISLVGSPVLTFWCNFQTEPGSQNANFGYDRRTITLTFGNGTALTESLGVTNAGPTVGACSAMAIWHEHMIPLQASWGTVQVTFTFDTVDNVFNEYAGWFLDDFKVTGSGQVLSLVTIESWDFDSGLQGWVVAGSDVATTWAADGSPSSGNAFQSAPNSLNYNNGTNYVSSAGTNSGTATSPVVSLGALPHPRLVFQCKYQTETLPGFDQRFLQISNDGFAGTPVFQGQLLPTGAGAAIGNCGPAGVWHTHTLDLNPAWGNVRLRIKFDTVDGIFNDFAGWFVDDVQVKALPVLGSEEGDDGVEGANGDSCGGSVAHTLPGPIPAAMALILLVALSMLSRRNRSIVG